MSKVTDALKRAGLAQHKCNLPIPWFEVEYFCLNNLLQKPVRTATGAEREFRGLHGSRATAYRYHHRSKGWIRIRRAMSAYRKAALIRTRSWETQECLHAATWISPRSGYRARRRLLSRPARRVIGGLNTGSELSKPAERQIYTNHECSSIHLQGSRAQERRRLPCHGFFARNTA